MHDDFGPHTQLVRRLIDRVAQLTPSEADGLFASRASWLLVNGNAVEREALAAAARAAGRSGRADAYVGARHAATAAFRQARSGRVGPWLTVGAAVANAAGALVVLDAVDTRHFNALFGPWRSAIGASLVPVGPGYDPVRPSRPTRTRQRIG